MAEMPVGDDTFARLEASLAGGPLAAAEALCAELRAAEDYHALFYAKLLAARVQLGVSPFPNGPSSELPAAAHAGYEDAIREAAREVGALYLAKRDLPRAWSLYRLVGDAEPLRQALRDYEPGPDDDAYPVIDIAWHQGLLPEKGFDLILNRHGVCSAITLVGGTDLSQKPAVREYCVRGLTAALHAQLSERVQGDLAGRGRPSEGSLAALLAANLDLCADDAYHVDVSHLSSVVQMALHLPPGESLNQARDLAHYGERLAPQFRGDGEPPFDDTYADYAAYLGAVAGENVEAALARFRAKAEREAAEGVSFPAQVLVNLLLTLNRPTEALGAAREFLGEVADEHLSCPSATELARRVGDYDGLSRAARDKGDAVTFLAARIAARG